LTSPWGKTLLRIIFWREERLYVEEPVAVRDAGWDLNSGRRVLWQAVEGSVAVVVNSHCRLSVWGFEEKVCVDFGGVFASSVDFYVGQWLFWSMCWSATQARDRYRRVESFAKSVLRAQGCRCG